MTDNANKENGPEQRMYSNCKNALNANTKKLSGRNTTLTSISETTEADGRSPVKLPPASVSSADSVQKSPSHHRTTLGCDKKQMTSGQARADKKTNRRCINEGLRVPPSAAVLGAESELEKGRQLDDLSDFLEKSPTENKALAHVKKILEENNLAVKTPTNRKKPVRVPSEMTQIHTHTNFLLGNILRHLQESPAPARRSGLEIKAATTIQAWWRSCTPRAVKGISMLTSEECSRTPISNHHARMTADDATPFTPTKTPTGTPIMSPTSYIYSVLTPAPRIDMLSPTSPIPTPSPSGITTPAPTPTIRNIMATPTLVEEPAQIINNDPSLGVQPCCILM